MSLKRILLIFFLFNIYISYGQDISKYLTQLDTVEGTKKIDIYNKIAWKLRNFNSRRALTYINKGILIADSLKYHYGRAMAHNFKGVLYRNLGLYNLALEEYQLAIDISLKNKIKDQLGYGYNNFGNLYLYQNIPDLSIKYLKQVIPIAHELKNKDMEAYALQNLGRSYLILNKSDSAKLLIEKAIKIRQKLNLTEKLGVSYKYLGDTYLQEKNYDQASYYYKISSKFANFNKDVDLFADHSLQKSKIFLAKHQIDSANFFATQSLETAKQIRSNLRIKNAYQQLSLINKSNQNYFEAYIYEHDVNIYKDSLYNEQVSRRIQSIEFSNEQKAKQAKIELLKKDILLNELDKKRTELLLYSLIAILIIIIVSSFGFYKSKEKIKKINKQLIYKNKEIKEINNELKEKGFELSVQSQQLKDLNEKLEKQTEDILIRQKQTTDSIQYASRIQSALLPFSEHFNKHFNQYFIFNKPRDIVSGDFYWLKKIDNTIVLVVADSTGHGVSGAFISVLGISILNELADSMSQNSTSQILGKARDRVKFLLHQKNGNENKQGLDISLIKIEQDKKNIQFSGAYNNAYIIENNKLTTLKADRMPVAYYRKEKDFSTHNYKYNSQPKIYLATDGFQDQTGGLKERKYFKRNFSDFLFKISNLPFPEQNKRIEQELSLWKGKLKQIDDILIIGTELKN